MNQARLTNLTCGSGFSTILSMVVLVEWRVNRISDHRKAHICTMSMLPSKNGNFTCSYPCCRLRGVGGRYSFEVINPFKSAYPRSRSLFLVLIVLQCPRDVSQSYFSKHKNHTFGKFSIIEGATKHKQFGGTVTGLGGGQNCCLCVFLRSFVEKRKNTRAKSPKITGHSQDSVVMHSEFGVFLPPSPRQIDPAHPFKTTVLQRRSLIWVIILQSGFSACEEVTT